MRLKDRTAIVTGAAQGIGAACAEGLAADGANVVLADIVDEPGESAADRIRAGGGQAHYVHADVGDNAAVSQLVAAALEHFGGVDIGVCVAGIAPDTAYFEVTEQELTRVFQVNVVGPFLLGQRIAENLVERQQPGSIINITSTSAFQSGPGQISYCTSKAGLGGLTRTMAIALAPHNIRVNAVAPGPTRTTLMDQALAVNPDVLKPIYARTPLGIAEPEQIAAAVSFLASDDASFMTGETVCVDGGRLALNYTVPVS